MRTIVTQITELLRTAQVAGNGGNADAYIAMLDDVILEAQLLRREAMYGEFGKQFKPAGEPVAEDAAPRLFEAGTAVRTKDGYIGTIAGHDKQGRAIVNVVWQACEYLEAHLTAIPDKSVLEAMKS